jgi:hypothetical protein
MDQAILPEMVVLVVVPAVVLNRPAAVLAAVAAMVVEQPVLVLRDKDSMDLLL